MARVLTGASDCFKPDYTIFFIAFDSEEAGSFGSQELLNKIFVPHYVRQGVRIQVQNTLLKIFSHLVDSHLNGLQGGIVLDTVFNYDSNIGSQFVPEEWKKVVPDVASRIEQNESKGGLLRARASHG